MPTSDKFKKVGAGASTTLSAPGKAMGATSLTVGSTANMPSDTGIIIAIRSVDTSGNLVAGTYTEFSATVSSGTSLAIVATPVYGSDQVYAAGATTQVFIPVSSYAQNTLIDGILVQHKQNGTHAAITADSLVIADGGNIEVDHILEAAAAHGVVIDGFAVKDGLVVGGAGTGVSNAGLDTTAGEIGGAWKAWTPTTANITLGTGGSPAITAVYTQIGKRVDFRIKVVLGSSGITVGTNPTFTVPVTPHAVYARQTPVGTGNLYDSSTTTNTIAYPAMNQTVIFPIYAGVSGALANYWNITSAAAPFTWAANDEMLLTGTYEAA